MSYTVEERVAAKTKLVKMMIPSKSKIMLNKITNVMITDQNTNNTYITIQ